MNDEKKKIKRQNTADINRISTKCIRVVFYFIVIAYGLLFFMNAYEERVKIYTLGLLLCLIVSVIPTIFVNIFHQENKAYMQHVIIISTVLVAVIMICDFSSLAYPLILFPILIAALYYNRTFVLYTALLMSVGILSVPYVYRFIPDLLVIQSYEDIFQVMTNVAVPLILVVIAMTFVAFFIVDRNSLMIEKYIDSGITMRQNENYLIYAFSEISETKSKETGEHIKRVAEYMKVLGKASGFDDDYCEKLGSAAMMHDIGKLMIPEEILDKPSRLTDDEYQIMKNHVLYGEALLADCPGQIMRLAATMAKEHHERWDGKGYLGMKGEEIAYVSRMIAVCDVFDALTADRSYKKGWLIEDAYDEIVKGSGKQFDPKVVRLFISNFDDFREIHARIPDKNNY